MGRKVDFVGMCRTGQVTRVREVLGRGVDVNSRDKLGYTGLMAAILGHEKVVNLLLDQPGIDVNLRVAGETALSLAITSGVRFIGVKLVRRLLAMPGVEVEARDGGG